jgi:hypothetical protein
MRETWKVRSGLEMTNSLRAERVRVSLVSAVWRGEEHPYEQKVVEGNLALWLAEGSDAERVAVRLAAARFLTLVSDPVFYFPRIPGGELRLVPFRIVALHASCELHVTVEFAWSAKPSRREKVTTTFHLGPGAIGPQGMAFVSYATLDLARVRPIFDGIRLRGVRTWMAEENLRYGDWFPPLIRDAVAAADKFLVFLSQSAAASRWVLDEINLALEAHERRGLPTVVPVVLETGVDVGRLERFAPILVGSNSTAAVCDDISERFATATKKRT